MKKSPAEIYVTTRKRLEQLVSIVSTPIENMALKLVDGSEIDISARQKINAYGLNVGNYGFGDRDFFLEDSSGNLYPVIGEFPVLIFPEKILRIGDTEKVDLKSPQYQEAYTEMAHYNRAGETASGSIDEKQIKLYMAGCAHPNHARACKFPRPPEVWVDALHDSVSQFEAYDYLAPMPGKKFLQLGGSGTHAVKALIGGASIAVLLTPMLQEAEYARVLAEHLGVADRLYCVIAVGEELPFKSNSFDSIYSGGCLHHMRTEMALGEMYRILTEKGRFSCVDPWKTLLHKIGTRVFGKREADVFCRPIDPIRLAPISIFPNHRITRHGPFLRYIFLALDKVGIRLTPKAMMRVTVLDDKIGSIFGLTEKFGGSIVICGEK